MKVIFLTPAVNMVALCVVLITAETDLQARAGLTAIIGDTWTADTNATEGTDGLISSAVPTTSFIPEKTIQDYRSQVIGSDYREVIVSAKNETNFKVLSNYIDAKQRAALVLVKEITLTEQTYDPSDTTGFMGLERDLATITDTTFAFRSKFFTLTRKLGNLGAYRRGQISWFGYPEDPVNEQASALNIALAAAESNYQEHLKPLPNLKANLANVKMDMAAANQRLQITLDPIQRGLDFKETISKYYVGLIGLFLLLFLFAVAFGRNSDIVKSLLSESGLQFVTIFSLIIAIILFGILAILKSSELAAILSGISGYILGKNQGTWFNQMQAAAGGSGGWSASGGGGAGGQHPGPTQPYSGGAGAGQPIAGEVG